jgi:hypothetical protein
MGVHREREIWIRVQEPSPSSSFLFSFLMVYLGLPALNYAIS